MKSNLVSFTISALIALSLMMAGCDELPTDANGNGDGDTTGVAAKVAEAVTALETEFFDFINDGDAGNINSPADIDFTASNTLFKEALALDPGHTEANFGAGLTELLIFTQDPEVQEVFDAWDAFADTGSFFVADSNLGLGKIMKSIPLGSSRAKSSFGILNENEVARTYINLLAMTVSNPPTLGDIQDIVENNFIPRLDSALAWFEVVDDSADFTFTVTPKMQGDVAEDTLEFDLTEIFVMEVALNLLRSFSSVAVAYNVGPSAYDSAAIIGLLSQGGGAASLRTNGAAQMAMAKATLLTASDKLDAAVAFLRAETDDQTDDVIVIRDGDLTEADLDSVTNYNADFRDAINTGITVEEDFNGDGVTQSLTLDFGALFDTPITDFKSLLPTYTVTVGRDTAYSEDYIWNELSVSGEITIDVVGTYKYNRMHRYNIWDDREYAEVDTSVSIPEFTRLVDSLLADFRADASLSDWYISIYWQGTFEAGTYLVNSSVYYSKTTRTADYSFYTGIITFAADNYADWTFQVENLNGFLPEITSSDVFKAFFGFVEADFEKETIIDFDFGGGGLSKRLPSGDDDRPARSRLIPWAYGN